jgi:putative transposase
MGFGRVRVNTMRIVGRDYAQAGAYFVTTCTHQRQRLFGRVKDGQMILSDYGRCVRNAWDALPQRFPNVDLDEFVIMPDHVHGIVTLTISTPLRPNVSVGAGSPRPAPTTDPAVRHPPAPARGVGVPRKNLPAVAVPSSDPDPEAATLGQVIAHFKYAATRSINAIRGCVGVPVFQRGYHEHIVRDDSEWRRIGWYIGQNPGKWRPHVR